MQQGQSRADFVAAFQRAEALNSDMSAHAGAYGEGLVAAALAAQGQARPGTAGKPSVEGRKELEGDDSSSADTSTSTTTPVNSGGMSTGGITCHDAVCLTAVILEALPEAPADCVPQGGLKRH